MPTENLIYEHLTKNDFILIYPIDYEPFPVIEEKVEIIYDSTITVINGFSCKSYTIETDFGKTICYYSDSLRSNSPILNSNHTTNFLRTYNNSDLTPIKTILITPFLTIEYELINMKSYEVPMEIFQLPEIGKTHKKMQRLMKGTDVRVKKLKK